jgi:flagellin
MVNGSLTVQLGTAFTQSSAFTTDPNVVLTGQEVMNFNFKVGTGTTATEDEISVDIGGISTTALGLDNASIDSKANADNASDAVSNAIDALQAKRSDVGAAQNRLDFAAQNVELTRENQEAARSELEDLNVAKAITEFSQQQLLVQAGTSTLSQANSLPQNLLQLFR